MGEVKRRRGSAAAGGTGGLPWRLVVVRQPKPIRELMVPSTAAGVVSADMLRYLVARAEEMRATARQLLAGAAASGTRAAMTATFRAIGDESFRALERQIEQHRAGIAGFSADLDRIQCRSGCAFCCYFNVEVTAFEVLRIADEMASGAIPDRRAAIATTAPEIAGLTRDARRATGLPCALLADGACSAYAVRPLACRALLSLDRSACEADFRAGLIGAARPTVPSLSLPMLFGMAIFTGQVAAMNDFQLASHGVELTAALAVMAGDATVTDRWLAGEDVFPRLA
jgi:hypothetical protein